jgi:hypothetical protein
MPMIRTNQSSASPIQVIGAAQSDRHRREREAVNEDRGEHRGAGVVPPTQWAVLRESHGADDEAAQADAAHNQGYEI